MNVVELPIKQSYTVSSIGFTYDELAIVYRKLKSYPIELREEIIAEATEMNGFNVFESIAEAEKEYAKEQYRLLQKGYMSMLSDNSYLGLKI